MDVGKKQKQKNRKRQQLELSVFFFFQSLFRPVGCRLSCWSFVFVEMSIFLFFFLAVLLLNSWAPPCLLRFSSFGVPFWCNGIKMRSNARTSRAGVTDEGRWQRREFRTVETNFQDGRMCKKKLAEVSATFAASSFLKFRSDEMKHPSNTHTHTRTQRRKSLGQKTLNWAQTLSSTHLRRNNNRMRKPAHFYSATTMTNKTS